MEETHEPKGEGIYEENENSSSANNGSKDAKQEYNTKYKFN